jgi:hypothetical protein
MEFRWNAWNVGHIAEHGVTPEEAEHIIRFATRHQRHHRGTRVVIGRGNSNRTVRVVYSRDPDGTIYVIHAMPRR